MTGPTFPVSIPLSFKLSTLTGSRLWTCWKNCPSRPIVFIVSALFTPYQSGCPRLVKPWKSFSESSQKQERVSWYKKIHPFYQLLTNTFVNSFQTMKFLMNPWTWTQISSRWTSVVAIFLVPLIPSIPTSLNLNDLWPIWYRDPQMSSFTGDISTWPWGCFSQSFVRITIQLKTQWKFGSRQWFTMTGPFEITECRQVFIYNATMYVWRWLIWNFNFHTHPASAKCRLWKSFWEWISAPQTQAAMKLQSRFPPLLPHSTPVSDQTTNFFNTGLKWAKRSSRTIGTNPSFPSSTSATTPSLNHWKWKSPAPGKFPKLPGSDRCSINTSG